MTPERRAVLLAYCRIDELAPEEELLFDEMVLAAESYMEQAGISCPYDGTPRQAQYDLCVRALVLDSWDRRGSTFSGGGSVYTVVDNPSFCRALNQLRMTEPAPDLGTEQSSVTACGGESSF